MTQAEGEAGGGSGRWWPSGQARPATGVAVRSCCFPPGRWQLVGGVTLARSLPRGTSALTTGRCGGLTWTEVAGGRDNLHDYEAGETFPSRDEAADLGVYGATSETHTAAVEQGTRNRTCFFISTRFPLK